VTANGRPIPPSSRPLPNVSAAALPYVEAEEDDIPPALTDEQLLDLRHRPNCNCAAHRDRAIVRDVSAISPRQRAAEVAKQKALASAQQPQNAYEHLMALAPNEQGRRRIADFGVRNNLSAEAPEWAIGEMLPMLLDIYAPRKRPNPTQRELSIACIAVFSTIILFALVNAVPQHFIAFAVVGTALAVLAGVYGYLRYKGVLNNRHQ
jgi:hypothetical protein